MHEELYSVRMRASTASRHLSGAERIVTASELDDIVRKLSARALSRGVLPDEIIVTIENLGGQTIRILKSLALVARDVRHVGEGRELAQEVLRRAGVAGDAARAAVDVLAGGAAPSGCSMRGAVLMDSETGERLEPDRERGIRASRFDWTGDAAERVGNKLSAAGFPHFRTKEALALATKVAHGPGVLAELCWSDEPEYLAGYVASRKTGYVRISHMKDCGDPRGGRVFFVDRNQLDMPVLRHYLEREPILIA